MAGAGAAIAGVVPWGAEAAIRDYAPSGYRLKFSEEFRRFRATPNGTADGSRCWRTTFFNGGRTHGNEPQIYTDSSYLGLNPFTVSGSPPILKIWMRKLPPQYATLLNRKYYSGVLSSDTFLNRIEGYWAIRLKAPMGGPDHWPAFWLYPALSSPSPYEEIDVYEGSPYGTDTVGVALHYQDTGEARAYSAAFPAIDATRWNTYAVLRTSTMVEFRINGRAVHRVSRAPEHRLHMILNYASRHWGLTDEDALPKALHVAWIRYYEKL